MKLRLALLATITFAGSALAIDSQTSRLNFTDDSAKSCAVASYSVYREAGVIKQCANGVETEIGADGGATPGGTANDLQKNDGAGGLAAYAGDDCAPGDFVTGIDEEGTVACDTAGGGGGPLSVVEIDSADSPYTVTTCLPTSSSGLLILADTTGGSITINLPAAAGQTGNPCDVKKIAAANTVTLDGNGGETIDDAATFAFTTNYASYTVTSDGDEWYVK